MSFYFLTFLLLAAGALLEWFRPQHEEKIYWVCWTTTTAVLCLRYGQGTDYVTYEAIYATIPTVIDLPQGYICGFFPETGWRLISALFKVLHAPFWVFTMVLGLVNMLLLHRFLNKYVPMKVTGLFLSYPVLYVVYMVSGLRQGLLMCLFLGILIPFYLEKKWIFYIIGVLVAASFHKVGYTWLVLPAAYYIPVWGMAVLTGLAVLAGCIIQIGAVEQFIVNLLPIYHVKSFLLENEISVFAVGERLISFGILFFLYLWLKKKNASMDAKTELFLKAYMCGVCFYMLMFGNAYYASRYAVIFKIVECAVLAALIKEREMIQKAAFGFFFALTLVMGYKNLNAMIYEGGYSGMGIHVWDFPYVSVLNQDEIRKYRDYDRLLQDKYDANIEDQQLWMIEE